MKTRFITLSTSLFLTFISMSVNASANKQTSALDADTDSHIVKAESKQNDSISPSYSRENSVATSSVPAQSGPVTVRYVYDALGRLIEVKDPINADAVYVHDDAGNRIEVIEQ